MSLREILCWPDPRLSVVCTPVQDISRSVKVLVNDMFETMYNAPGRGLAAPQVGVEQRIFVMDTEWKNGPPAPLVFINPEVSECSGSETVQSEGCLSVPGVVVEVSRPERVRVRWTDLDGDSQNGVFEGFAAACVQHEIDHLNGIVTLDRLAPEQRDGVIKAYHAALA